MFLLTSPPERWLPPSPLTEQTKVLPPPPPLAHLSSLSFALPLFFLCQRKQNLMEFTTRLRPGNTAGPHYPPLTHPHIHTHTHTRCKMQAAPLRRRRHREAAHKFTCHVALAAVGRGSLNVPAPTAAGLLVAQEWACNKCHSIKHTELSEAGSCLGKPGHDRGSVNQHDGSATFTLQNKKRVWKRI